MAKPQSRVRYDELIDELLNAEPTSTINLTAYLVSFVPAVVIHLLIVILRHGAQLSRLGCIPDLYLAGSSRT